MTVVASQAAVPVQNAETPSTDASGRPLPVFAHASEAEMARILDFYGVQWDYEPRTFPILWNLDGAVVESFSPDFYLPELDLYLEMTTLKQRLVRKKNRKLRRLRELYPAIRIKLFYARDFRAMMLKYGRLALADSLSGTLGQVTSVRVAIEDSVEVPLADAVALSGTGGTRRRTARRPAAIEPTVLEPAASIGVAPTRAGRETAARSAAHREALGE